MYSWYPCIHWCIIRFIFSCVRSIFCSHFLAEAFASVCFSLVMNVETVDFVLRSPYIVMLCSLNSAGLFQVGHGLCKLMSSADGCFEVGGRLVRIEEAVWEVCMFVVCWWLVSKLGRKGEKEKK